jgi:hypothetical protein
MSGIEAIILSYIYVSLIQFNRYCAEKQPATYNTGPVCGNFGLTPVLSVSC